MVIAENLAEEDSQGDQGSKDAVSGLAELLRDDLSDPVGRESLAETELGVEGDGTEQGSELSRRRSVDSIGHDGSSLLDESRQTLSIQDKEDPSCTYSLGQTRYGSVSAIQLLLKLYVRFVASSRSVMRYAKEV